MLIILFKYFKAYNSKSFLKYMCCNFLTEFTYKLLIIYSLNCVLIVCYYIASRHIACTEMSCRLQETAGRRRSREEREMLLG